MTFLLCDYAAGDAVAGSAGGIGLHVVGFGVDDDCGTAIAEERVGSFAESYVGVLKFRIGLAFSVDGKVLHVAGVVAFGIVESMLFAFGIEMAAGRLEVGRIALGSLMKVNGVLAGRKIVKFKLEAGARSLLPEEHAAHTLALGVLKFDFSFRGAGKRGDD